MTLMETVNSESDNMRGKVEENKHNLCKISHALKTREKQRKHQNVNKCLNGPCFSYLPTLYRLHRFYSVELHGKIIVYGE
jgi:hypothetical protein